MPLPTTRAVAREVDAACAAGLEACDMAELSRFLGSEARRGHIR